MTDFRKPFIAICAAALFALTGSAADTDNVKWSFDLRAGDDGAPRIEGQHKLLYHGKTDLTVENGALLLDHTATVAPRTYNIGYVFEPELTAPGGVLVAEYRGALVKPGENPTIPVFNLYLAGSAGEGKPVYASLASITAVGITTNAGVYAPAGFDTREMHTVRATLDTATGDFTLAVDGKPALRGKLKPAAKGKPQIWFGDGSAKMNGRAKIEYLRVGKLAD